MLRVVASASPLVRDAFVPVLGLEKKESNPLATIYQKEGWIFLLLTREITADTVAWIASEFIADRLYLPFFGYSVDMVHEVGDVIAPNVFATYDPRIEGVEITKENRDTFMQDAGFLEIYEEQKDYYVEDYGLSIGGIAIGGAPASPSDDLMGKMMLAYEADIYTEIDMTPLLDIIRADEVTTVLFAGVVTGKANTRYPGESPHLLTAKNMVTTMSLMEE